MIVAATGRGAARSTGAGGADEARYLIPLSPFFIGAIFAGFRLVPRPWAASVVAALAACAAVVGGIHFYATVTPSTVTVSADVSARSGAYRWVKEHVPRGSEVVAYNDLQAFLYSDHPTATGIRHFSPGHTFVVQVPPGSIQESRSTSWTAFAATRCIAAGRSQSSRSTRGLRRRPGSSTTGSCHRRRATITNSRPSRALSSSDFQRGTPTMPPIIRWT